MEPSNYNLVFSQKLLRQAVVVLFTSCIFLEVQLPDVGVKIGNLIMLAGCLLAFLMATKSKVGFSYHIYLSDKVFFCYIIWCFFSVIWSPSKADTLAQFSFIFSIWMASLSVRYANINIAIGLIVKAGVLVSLFSLASVIFPSFAFQPTSSTGFPELRGVFEHQQRLGLFSALSGGLLVLLILNNEHKISLGWGSLKVYFSLFLILICFFSAQARSYGVFAIVSLVATLGLARAGIVRRVSFSFIALLAIWIYFDFDRLIAYFEESGADITLTGRTIIWERTLAAARESHWIGYGYGSFTDKSFDSIWGVYRPPSAHTSILQAYFETGAVGVILISCFLLLKLFYSIRFSLLDRKFSYSLYVVLLSIMASVTGVTYAGKPSILLVVAIVIFSMESHEFYSRVKRGSTLGQNKL